MNVNFAKNHFLLGHVSLCIFVLTQESRPRNVTGVKCVIKHLLIRHTFLHIFELILEKNLLIVTYVVKHSPTVLRSLHISDLTQGRNRMLVKYVKGLFLEGDRFPNISALTQEKNRTLVYYAGKPSLRVGVSLCIFAHIQEI
jgi:hypothetical protein